MSHFIRYETLLFSLIFSVISVRRLIMRKINGKFKEVEEKCFSPLLRLWIFTVVVVYFVGRDCRFRIMNQEEHRVQVISYGRRVIVDSQMCEVV